MFKFKKLPIVTICLLIGAFGLGACDLSNAHGEGHVDPSHETTKTLSSIEIASEPSKLTYYVNEEFSYDGLKVNAIYSDSSKEDITSKITLVTVDTSSQGEKEITLSYEGKEASFTVTVIKEQAILQSLEIENEPTKVVYEVGDAFSSAGLKVNAVYSDGSKVDVTSEVRISNVSLSSAGQKTVTVSYSGKNITFTITVNEKPASEVYSLVTNANDLIEGDTIIITASSKNMILSTNLTNNYFLPVSKNINSEQITDLPEKAQKFLLGKQNNKWTLSSLDGKLLGATDVKKLAWDSGEKTWNISIEGDSATISSTKSSYGRFLYNVGSTRFTTYTSNTSKSMLLPEIYRLDSKEPVYPTSISLSGNEEVTVGKSTSLSVNFTPKNTNQRTISWSSSDTSVATVSGGKVTGVSAGSAIITAKAKDENDNDLVANFTINVVEQVLDSWTIMIYLSGNDLESGVDDYGNYNYLASLDIEEILSVSNQPDDVNIIIQTGGTEEWSSKYDIKNDELGRYEVQNNQLVKVDALDNANMGSATTFKSFLTWGLTEYPAEKTGVILWNHGGALDGVCYDELYGDDSLTNSEASSSFSEVFSTLNITDKLEFIGYDACLMQVQDIAEFNSSYFNYMVAAEESEAGEGWEYSTWVDDLYAKKDTEVILKEICNGFINSYEKTYGKQYDNDQTLSVLDLNKMSQYKTAFENLASSMSSVIASSSFNTLMKTVKNYADTWLDYQGYYKYVHQYYYPTSWFSTVVEDGETYYLLHGYYLYGTFDVTDFLNKLESSSLKVDSTKISQAKAALSDLIIYNNVGGEAGESYGLALVCPVSNDSIDYKSSETHFSNWRSAVTSKSRNY